MLAAIRALLNRRSRDCEECPPGLTWRCMICDRIRPDAEISVASRTLGWLTVNVRFCRDSDECAIAAEQRAAADAARLWARRDA